MTYSSIITTYSDLPKNYFWKKENGTLFPTVDLNKGIYTVGAPLDLSLFSSVFVLNQGNKEVGYYFQSPYKEKVSKFFYLTWFRSNEGKAESYRASLKTENLLILNFENHGLLAISPQWNFRLSQIFENQ